MPHHQPTLAELIEDITRIPGNRYAVDQARAALTAPNRRIIGIVGAGVSAATLPLWDGFLTQLLDHAIYVGCVEAGSRDHILKGLGRDPLSYAQDLKLKIGPQFAGFMRTTFEVPASPQTATTHELVVALGVAGFITTNYDTFLNDAWQRAFPGQPQAHFAWNGFDATHCQQFSEAIVRAPQLKPIIHAHGGWRDLADSIAVGNLDYTRLYNDRWGALFGSYFEDLGAPSLLWIGSGLNDPWMRIAAASGLWRSSMSSQRIRHFGIVPLDDRDAAVSERQRLRRDVGLEPIFYPVGWGLDGDGKHIYLDAVLRMLGSRASGDDEDEDDPRTAIVLDASSDPGAITAQLMRLSADDAVVLRRQHGMVVYHYAFTAEKVLQAIRSRPAPTLREALDLHERQAARTRSDEGAGAPGSEPVVLLRGDTVVGVEWPTSPRRLSRRVLARDAESTPAAGAGPDSELGPIASALRGHIDAPEVAAPRSRMTVGVSLRSAAIADAVLALEANSGASITLEVHLSVGDGLSVVGSATSTLVVPRSAPESRHVEFEIALPDRAESEPLLTSIVVLFVENGRVCGRAVHRLAVTAAPMPAVDPRDADRMWFTPSTEPSDVTLGGTAASPPDLTIAITKPDRNAATGRFVVSFLSPHVQVPSPEAIDLGEDAASFAKFVADQMPALDATPTMFDLVVPGLGQLIADKLPGALWRVLHEVKAKIARAPHVLLATEDPHMPWELALMPAPLLDPTRSALLGTQVPIGRWLIGEPGPALPPAPTVDGHAMVVVNGDYLALSGFRPLVEAMNEGADLGSKYGAKRLFATTADIVTLLAGTIPADIVHFACHGTASAANPLHAAILLQDRFPLHSHVFRSTALGRSRRPFLFLNACQVGTGGTSLGTAAGFPAHATMGGFRAFVGPLWLVEDATARAIAMAFYQATLGDHLGAGEALRATRESAFKTKKATALAYVLYGDPTLSLSLSEAPS